MPRIRDRIRTAGRDLLFGLYHNTPFSLGRPIYEYDWDVLIVLDGCRPDTLEEVAGDYEYLPDDIDTTFSVASCSWEWMERTFDPKYSSEVAATAYITANPYSDSYLSASDFGFLDEVWRYAWDEEVGTVRARPVTDRAIRAGRDRNFERIVVHYMQPHFPSIPDPLQSGIDLEVFGEEWDSVWQRLEAGGIDRETVLQSYRENLKYVLDDVGILVDNLDSRRTILTADHANAIGEWDLYGHPVNKPAPVIRRVPWVPIETRDAESYDPNFAGDHKEVTDVEDKLSDLGYL